MGAHSACAQDPGEEKKPAASESQPGASSRSKPDQGGSQQAKEGEKKEAGSQQGSEQKKEGEKKNEQGAEGEKKDRKKDKEGAEDKEKSDKKDEASTETEKKSESGFKFILQEQSEVWGNLFGGGKQGTSYNGLTSAIIDVDLEKAVGWDRARFYASGFQIHGHGPSRALVGADQLVSNIEATPSLKLYDLWLEQRFPGRISLRFGQEGVNDEMMTTAYGALYLNSSFGFPGLPAADLPSGGPNYPLATPFVRVRWRTSDQLSVVGALYNGDPAPPGPGDPQIRDRNGTAFRLNGNTYSFAEFRYAEDLDAPDNLQTNYKLGVWYHSGRFADRRIDIGGGLLADPTSTGLPKQHRGDLAVYGILDQILWRREGTKDQGIGVFLQVQAGPSDRNLSDLFIEGGVNWSGPFADRPSDVAGIAFAYLGISPAAQNFSRDLVAFGRAAAPFASNETIIEATYKAQITESLTLQPDAQLVLNPNAGVPGFFGNRVLPSALVLGMRATLKLQSP
jgi:porin